MRPAILGSTKSNLQHHSTPSFTPSTQLLPSRPLFVVKFNHNGWCRYLQHCWQAGRRPLRTFCRQVAFSRRPWWPTFVLTVPSQLAMGILGSLFGGAYYAASGPKKSSAAANTPPINASSSDEADFIKYVQPLPNLFAANPIKVLTTTVGSSSRRPTRSNNWYSFRLALQQDVYHDVNIDLAWQTLKLPCFVSGFRAIRLECTACNDICFTTPFVCIQCVPNWCHYSSQELLNMELSIDDTTHETLFMPARPMFVAGHIHSSYQSCTKRSDILLIYWDINKNYILLWNILLYLYCHVHS